MTADEEPARDITQKTRKKLWAPDFFSILSIAKTKKNKEKKDIKKNVELYPERMPENVAVKK